LTPRGTPDKTQATFQITALEPTDMLGKHAAPAHYRKAARQSL